MRRTAGFGAALLVYAAVAAILLFHRGLLAGTYYLGQGSDPSLYVWMFRFLPDAIAHLHNPIVLTQAWAPYGLNITQSTTTPTLALLAWPLTALLGPVAAFNIISIAAPALAAATAFLFASAYTMRWSVAFVSGWIFGFSSYVFAALLGHLQVDFIAFVPLAFLAVALRAQERLSNPGYILLLVIALVLQFGTALEIFTTEAMFLPFFAVIAQITRPGGRADIFRPNLDNLLFGMMIAYLIALIVISPLLWSFFEAYLHLPQSFQNGGYWSADLLNYVIPTPVTLIGGHAALPLSHRFLGNWSEDLEYIGAPLLILTGIAIWQLRRMPASWSLSGLLLVGFVCTLGPRLRILGHSSIPLPWAIPARLPVFDNIEPARIMVFALLAVAGLIALWIERLQHGRSAALVGVALAALLALPATKTHDRQHWWDSPTPTARLFLTGRYRQLIPRGSTVLFLPFKSNNGHAMFWQATTPNAFRMTNGYGSMIPPALAIWPAARILEGGLPVTDFPTTFDEFAKAERIETVIVPDKEMPNWDQALRAAGWHGTRVGRLTVFDWSEAARAATKIRSPREASHALDAAHLRALRAAARCLLQHGATTIDPATAVAAHCLAPGFGPTKGSTPHNSWGRMGGWLGRFNHGIGIGLQTDGVSAARFAAGAGSDATAIYYPYPHRFRPSQRPVANGEFLEVLTPAALLASPSDQAQRP